MSPHTRLFEVVRAALLDLEGVGVAHALVGGLAIGVHGLPRATRDADFALAVDDDVHAERVIADLRARGYGLALVLEQTETSRLSTARLTSPLDARTMIDVLFASSGIEPEIVAAAEVAEVGGGVACAVARRGHMVALKTLSRTDTRPQDDQDLGALLVGIDDSELARARDALALIAARGFARGKDLAAELEAQIARWR
jgi:hypothetical protein